MQIWDSRVRYLFQNIKNISEISKSENRDLTKYFSYSYEKKWCMSSTEMQVALLFVKHVHLAQI